jgi:hypothetical protein
VAGVMRWLVAEAGMATSAAGAVAAWPLGCRRLSLTPLLEFSASPVFVTPYCSTSGAVGRNTRPNPCCWEACPSHFLTVPSFMGPKTIWGTKCY